MTKREGPKRHFVIPDLQVRPGVPLDHIDWIAESIVHYKPDVIVCLGDFWDFPSLSGHEEPGSVPLEGKRYADDLHVGNEAFKRLCAPMEKELERIQASHKRRWKPRKVFLNGNHEYRADRVASNNAKWLGTIGSDQCDVRDWERYPFLEVVKIDGFLYSHFFQSSHSPRPIGGTIINKLTKIGASFVHGHVQGLDMGTKIMGSGQTWWGFSAGSAYVHVEPYRGAQGQRHWRGVLLLNETEDGECCPMPLTLSYLCRKYTGMDLATFHRAKYPNGDWNHLT